jgi:hypothetical protein
MINFLPKTIWGKLSLVFIDAFSLFFVILQLFIKSGQRGGATFFSNLLLAIPALLAAIFGISAFFVGIFGIIKEKEKGIMVFLTSFFGFLVFLFVLCEILFPH